MFQGNTLYSFTHIISEPVDRDCGGNNLFKALKTLIYRVHTSLMVHLLQVLVRAMSSVVKNHWIEVSL